MNKRSSFALVAFTISLAGLVLETTSRRADAVGTSHWNHSSAADFSAGSLNNVVATSLGELKLSHASKTLLTQDAHVSAVYALAEAKDGTLYAATGPQGALLSLKDGKVETAASLGDDTSCFALLIDHQQRIVVGTGGKEGKIFRIDHVGDKPKEIFSSPDVQYIWSMLETADGNLYAATGPNGQLFEIHPDGTNKVLFDSDENNLMSLVVDAKGDTLYAGSDPNGYVYRINRKTGESFVVYDAAETEISALAIDSRGNLYAGTAQSVNQDTGTSPLPATDEKGGRPESEDVKTIPLPGDAPDKPPEPPKMPLPGASDPHPIPKEKTTEPSHPLNLAIVVDATKQPTRPTNEQEEPGDDDLPLPGKKRGRSPIAGAIQQAEAAGGAPQIPAPGKGGEPTPEGNAIYKIDPDGFVKEIFRQPVLVLSIVENDGVLIVGTGNEGKILQINPSAEETSVIAKLDPKEALCLLPSAKGSDIFVGLANDGQIASLSSGFADKGEFTSPVLDATQVSKFGKMHLHGQLPAETSLTVSTRSGNVAEPSEHDWSKWTDEVPASQYLPITAPAARFLQYRLSFSTKDPKRTASVDEVSVAYQMPNLAPTIKSVSVSSNSADARKAQQPSAGPVTTAPKPEASSMVSLSWEGSDPNGDAIQYALYFRTFGDGPWILLKDKLSEMTFYWDTKSVADGRYEVKVVGSDALANAQGEGKSAARVSEAIEVDNTPPTIGDLLAEAVDGGAKISTRVADRSGTVANLEYSVDSSTDWQAVLPSDTVADSPQEAYAFTVCGLSAGPHQISLRATDDHGNIVHENVTVHVK